MSDPVEEPVELTCAEAMAELERLARTGIPRPWGTAKPEDLAGPGAIAAPQPTTPTAAVPRSWSEQTLRCLLESLPDALVAIDQDGTIVLVNARAEALFCYPREELLGQAIEILIPERFRREHIDQRAGYFASPHVRPMGARRDLFGRHKNGATFPVEISLSPLQTEHGLVVTAVIHDITWRKREEAKFRSLVESIPAVTFVAPLDENLPEFYVSPQIEQLLGFSKEEWLADPVLWYRQLHPDDRDRWNVQFAPTCAEGKPFRSVYRFLARDGRVVWVHGEAEMVCDGDGRPLFLQGVAFDITGMKQAEEDLKTLAWTLQKRVAERTANLEQQARELARSNADLDDFAYVASHDLKAPLRSVRFFIDALCKHLAGDLSAESKDWIGRAIDRLDSLHLLIDDLYYYARVDREGTVTTTDCNKVLEQARENLFEDIKASKSEVSAGPLPTVQGVETQLVRVLQNLIQNAIKFRGDRPIRVHVDAARQGAAWLFRVQDNGIGIEPDDLPRLFKKIGQEGRMHSRSKYPGMGFGLGICKKIVESHGGRIWVESVLDQGSTFSFTLPVRDPPPPANPDPAL